MMPTGIQDTHNFAREMRRTYRGPRRQATNIRPQPPSRLRLRPNLCITLSNTPGLRLRRSSRQGTTHYGTLVPEALTALEPQSITPTIPRLISRPALPGIDRRMPNPTRALHRVTVRTLRRRSRMGTLRRHLRRRRPEDLTILMEVVHLSSIQNLPLILFMDSPNRKQAVRILGHTAASLAPRLPLRTFQATPLRMPIRRLSVITPLGHRLPCTRYNPLAVNLM